MYTGNSITLTKAPGTGYHFENNTGINIGSYYIRAVLENGYIWQDNSTSYKIITCNIEGRTVTIPNSTNNCNTNAVYTGSPVTLTKNPQTGYTFSNNIQTNTGSYKISAKLDQGYVWSDGSTTDKEFYCVLAPNNNTNAVKDITSNERLTEAQETLGQRLAMLRIDTDKTINRLYYCLGNCAFTTSVFTTATNVNPYFDGYFAVYAFNPASQVRGVWYYTDYRDTTSSYVNFRRIKSSNEEKLNMFVAYTNNGEVTNYADVKSLDLSY